MTPTYSENNVTLYVGDCLDVLRTMPDASVNCCVTSPPYWGLRQYLFDGATQIRHNLPYEKQEEINTELARRGILPRD